MNAPDYRRSVLEAFSIYPIVDNLTQHERGQLNFIFGLIESSFNGVHMGGTSISETVRAIQVLNFIDEMAWLKIGAAVGYYSASAYEDVTSSINARHPLNSEITEFERHVNRDLVHLEPGELTRVHPDSFLGDLASAREDITPEFREFARLISLAADSEWENKLRALRELRDLIRGNLSLSLPDSSVDQYSWALSGAELLFVRDHANPLGSNLIQLVRAHPARVEELRQIREEISRFAVRMSANEQAGAIRSELGWSFGGIRPRGPFDVGPIPSVYREHDEGIDE